MGAVSYGGEPIASTDHIYIVQAGDTLTRIAYANGLTLDELLEIPGNENFIANPNLIFPGQFVYLSTITPLESSIPITGGVVNESTRATSTVETVDEGGGSTFILGGIGGALRDAQDAAAEAIQAGGGLVGDVGGFFGDAGEGIIREAGPAVSAGGDALREFGGGLQGFAGGLGEFAGDLGDGVTGIVQAIPLTVWILLIGLAVVLVTGFNSGGLKASVQR